MIVYGLGFRVWGGGVCDSLAVEVSLQTPLLSTSTASGHGPQDNVPAAG